MFPRVLRGFLVVGNEEEGQRDLFSRNYYEGWGKGFIYMAEGSAYLNALAVSTMADLHRGESPPSALQV
jgi:hypothetical protein